MSLSILLSQASLAATILASTAGSYIALSPPHPSANSPSSSSSSPSGDTIRWLHLTNKHTTKLALAPFCFLTLYTSTLVCLYPSIPPSILRHGTSNLNTGLITWSASTSLPLALILCAGIPLRLVSYAALGGDFTFALARPKRLTTTGIYRYVQHPSYTGLVVLVASNVALLGRMDGALGCWVPPQWYQALRALERVLAPVGLSVVMLGVWTRVRQEEGMLQSEFGLQWERWHANTARFVPWIF